VLRPSPTADAGRMHIEGAASDILIHRIDSLPGICGRLTPTDATTVFDILWETYREQYPFFDLRHVDWNAARERQRPRAASASPSDLFIILRDMIEPLHDAHTSLGAPTAQLRYYGFRPDPDSIGRAGWMREKEIIRTRYLRAPPHTWLRGAMSLGMLAGAVAYLRITRFEDYASPGGYRADRRALEGALDSAFTDARSWRGLVIDVRVNGGGADPLGLAIASRLATAAYTAYAKVARSSPEDPRQMTPPQPSVVTPSTRPGWQGAVVELTSRYSISAAETFTQALMGRRPTIERVGENTQGVFSDVLARHLPNGWEFGLPNELFLTAQGTSFDGAGIPPTIPIPTFDTADLAAGRDPGLERAIAILH
jgi:hypothetical protein